MADDNGKDPITGSSGTQTGGNPPADDQKPVIPNDNGNNPITGSSGTQTGGNPPADDQKLIIPDETQAQFPDLVKMILESKSMNNQERNYWLQVLPVMTQEQISELRDILESEIKKLNEIEKKYSEKPAEKTLSAEDIAKLDEEKRKKRAEQKRKEAEERERENPDDILASLGV